MFCGGVQTNATLTLTSMASVVVEEACLPQQVSERFSQVQRTVSCQELSPNRQSVSVRVDCDALDTSFHADEKRFSVRRPSER